MKKDLIISLAVDGRDRYSEVVKGLQHSIIDANWEGDVKIYKEWPDWVTPHERIPYAFKYDLIKQAINEGYNRVFWLDAVMRLVPGKDIRVLLNKSKAGVVAFHNIGHDLKFYINDTAVKNLEILPGELDGVFQTWGGALFFDWGKWEARKLLLDIFTQIAKGSFNNDDTAREDFKGHRHDQATISWLLHINEIPLLPYGVIAAKKDVTDQTYIIYGD